MLRTKIKKLLVLKKQEQQKWAWDGRKKKSKVEATISWMNISCTLVVVYSVVNDSFYLHWSHLIWPHVMSCHVMHILTLFLNPSGLFTDADKYKLDFLSEALTLDDKLILLSTVLFLDYLFFEGKCY
jgi:hypothetical protein